MDRDISRADWHLENWARYLRGRYVRLGYPPRVPLLSNGGASEDFDSMCEDSDRVSARACDAVIEGLPEIEQRALSTVYLGTVFRFPADPNAIAEATKPAVYRELQRRGIY